MKYCTLQIIVLSLLFLFATGCHSAENAATGEAKAYDSSGCTVIIENEMETVKKRNESVDTYLASASEIERVYSDILLHPKEYEEYYAITDQIPSDDKRRIEYHDSTYCFAVHDINRDGKMELLLGYGCLEDHYDAPQILLNILQYYEETGGMIDLDGQRTYPLMDNLYFYETGHYSTQNWAGDLYTECWRLEDEPTHYWYGWERGGEFYDTNGQELQLHEYYSMIGDDTLDVEWSAVTEERVIEQIFRSGINKKLPASIYTVNCGADTDQ